MLSRHAQHKQWYLLGTIKFEQKIANTHANKHTHPPTHRHADLDYYNKLSLLLNLKGNSDNC